MNYCNLAIHWGTDNTGYNREESQSVLPSEVSDSLDNNKAKLEKKDVKFFVLTISPSQAEIRAMGSTVEEQSQHLKDYTNREVMQNYAFGFGKSLETKDLLYYGKIHRTRGYKDEDQLHAHILVSRKDKSNRIKLSPETNHRSTAKGCVKGGFDRMSFFRALEISFDQMFQYDRSPEESFDYLNVMKNGSIDKKIL